MASLHRLVLEVSETSDQLKSTLDLARGDQAGFVSLGNFCHAVAGGSAAGKITVKHGAVQAAGTVTFTGNPTADDTVTIANVVLTAKAEPADDSEFDIGVGATANATNLAAAINANDDLDGVVTATSAAGVVTITAVVPGKAGNGLGLAEALTNATITAAFTGGSDGDSVVIDKL